MKPKLKVSGAGTKSWFLNGKLHREDGPAIEYIDGEKYWYLNGELHREDGPAIECSDGEKHWYLNGVRHREDGPAGEYPDGEKHWFLNGVRHRVDGPAVEFSDGTRWYLNGKELIGKQIQILKKINEEKDIRKILLYRDLECGLFKDVIKNRISK